MKSFNRIIACLIILFIVACHTQKAPASSGTSAAASKLNGTWELTYVTGPRIAFAGLYPDKKPQITFNLPSIEVSGNSSCNGFGSKVTLDGSKMMFSDPIGTMIACEGIGEQTFYKALKQVNSYSIDSENVLTFSNNETPLMRFMKK